MSEWVSGWRSEWERRDSSFFRFVLDGLILRPDFLTKLLAIRWKTIEFYRIGN